MPHETDDRLIDAIYEAAVVPGQWPGVLCEMTRLGNGAGGVLVVARGADQTWISSSEPFDEMIREHYRQYSVAQERTTRLIAARHPGFLTDLDVFAPGEMDDDPVYRDFLYPRGLGVGIATAIQVPSGDTMIFHVEGHRENGHYGPDLVDRFDRLRPHLARAALMSARLWLQRLEAAMAVLETLGLPGGVIDGGGRLAAANGLFEELVPGVFQDRNAGLSMRDKAADRLLQDALRRARAGRLDGAGRSVPVRRQSPADSLIVHVLPLRGAARDIFTAGSALILATPLAVRGVPGADVIQSLFDLTPAEAKVAAAIATGATTGEIARLTGASVATVRNQLNRVLAKSGLGRQAELVGLLRAAGVVTGGFDAG